MINTKAISPVEAAVLAAPERARAKEEARRKELREATKKLVAEREPRRERRRRLIAERKAERKQAKASVSSGITVDKKPRPDIVLLSDAAKERVRIKMGGKYDSEGKLRRVKGSHGPGPASAEKTSCYVRKTYVSPAQRHLNKVANGEPIANRKAKAPLTVVGYKPLNTPVKNAVPVSRKERLRTEWKRRNLDKQLREQFAQQGGSVSKIAA